MDNQQDLQNQRVILEIRTSRTGEETPEAMVQFLSSLLNLKKTSFFFFTSGVPISVEVGVLDQRIRFYLTIPAPYQAFAESQLSAQYPKVLMAKSKDYLPDLTSSVTTLSLGQLKLQHDFIYPLRTYAEFKDVDPMGSVLSVLSKAQPGDSAV